MAVTSPLPQGSTRRRFRDDVPVDDALIETLVVDLATVVGVEKATSKDSLAVRSNKWFCYGNYDGHLL